MAGDGTPDAGGLWDGVLSGWQIDHAAWLRARAMNQPVGTCRRCGGHLIPETPKEHHGRIDYTAACPDDKCRYEMVAPGGRVMRGSTAWSKSGGAARAAAFHKRQSRVEVA